MTGPTKGLCARVGVEVGGMDMEEEVKEAYEVFKRIDVLDVFVGACAPSSVAFFCDTDSWFWDWL
jgi:hypothetical protein